MTQEDKDILLKDLCARLPYGLKCLVNFKDGTKHVMTLKTGFPNSFGKWEFYSKDYSTCSDDFKPYLRSMLSMTKEELFEVQDIIGKGVEIREGFISILDSSIKSFSYLELQAVLNYFNAHHLDYLGWIPNGLAIEVTKENNPYKD